MRHPRHIAAAAGRAARPLLVTCIAYDGWSLFEAGIASEVFGIEHPEVGRPLYRFQIAQLEPGALRSRGGLHVRAPHAQHLLLSSNLVVVPGWRDHRETPPAGLLASLRAAHAAGVRLLSICTGAFVLAAASLLDGRRATTHWRYARAFRERFPRVDLRPDVLYVDEGDVVTAAGSAAGIDACLHIVRQDYGAAVANLIARAMVAAPHRAGGQAQFVSTPIVNRANGSLAAVLDWARGRLDRPLRIADLAKRAAMSERTFLRHFTSQVGIGPKQWLRRERVAAAQALLETSSKRLEVIADAAGFGSISALRQAFRDSLGISPTHYRKQFRSASKLGTATN